MKNVKVESKLLGSPNRRIRVQTDLVGVRPKIISCLSTYFKLLILVSPYHHPGDRRLDINSTYLHEVLNKISRTPGKNSVSPWTEGSKPTEPFYVKFQTTGPKTLNP